MFGIFDPLDELEHGAAEATLKGIMVGLCLAGIFAAAGFAWL